MMQYHDYPGRPPRVFNEQYDYSFKLVLIGDLGVGKSKLYSQFVQHEFTESSDWHLGLDHKILKLDDPDMYGMFQRVKVFIQDTRSGAIDHDYYYDAVGALLVYDVTNRESYQSVPKWLQMLRNYGRPGIVIMLVGNKIDSEDHLREVPTEDAKAFAAEKNILFCETSAREHIDVLIAFYSIINEIHRIVKSIQ
ncbi:Gtp-bound Rab11 in complex with Fip3 [Suillus cothurnatus]|nr:Gtp-bound Rab11 in complex with Fip3 [Suillus cothurnatus]